MARMMGTQQELDLLTSLLFTVTNEAQYKERVVKLHEMTTVHRAALDAAVKAKGEAEAAVHNADTVMAERSQTALAAEAKAKAALAELNGARAAHEAKVNRDTDALDKMLRDHSSKVLAETAKLRIDREAHQQAVANHATVAR